MTEDSKALFILTGRLGLSPGLKPFTPTEWSALRGRMERLGVEPSDLLSMEKSVMKEKLNLKDETAERIAALTARSAGAVFALSSYTEIGIDVVTTEDGDYPKKLKSRLEGAVSYAPLFYFMGDLSLLDLPLVGYVGSRNIDADDEAFTRHTVETTMERGFGVVSGGARGVDSLSAGTALGRAPVVEFVSDSLIKKLADPNIVRAIRNGELLILSSPVPEARFTVGTAMERNKYIYTSSDATVIIRSDKGKGGTWAGATENFRHGWVPTYCRERLDSPGNLELIRMGARPIDETWDGNIDLTPIEKEPDFHQGELF